MFKESSTIGLRIVITLLAGLFLLPSKQCTTGARGPLRHPSRREQKVIPVQAWLNSIPLSFIENPAAKRSLTGSAPSRTAYFLQGRDVSASFSREGVALTLADRSRKGERKTAVIQLEFPEAHQSVELRGEGRQSTRISYFSGRRRNWQTELASFDRVAYSNLWPGIDLVFSGDQQNLKYEFIVHPGADPRQIRLAYRGLTAPLQIDPDGRLEIATPLKTIRDEKPVSFQDLGRRVETSYRLTGQDEQNRQVYGFKVGRYDRRKVLVIDPAIQVYAGFIGGSGEDEGHGVAVDAAGNAYITGVTTSLPATFPDLVGPGATFGGRSDAFVARIKADGSGLDYAGYIGGSGDEAGHAIAVDATGNAYIGGWTSSSETTFPVAGGPRLTYGGAIDGFVAKINPTGTGLVYCGYIGGDDQDEALDLAVDNLGRAYLTGLTASAQATFPVTVGPDLTFNGTIDAFVARVKADGSGLDYAGYIGGAGNDQACGIAVDASNNAYLTGLTNSPQATFPVSGPLDATFNGASDAFVAKLNSSGTNLIYCGYIGGSGYDEALDIAVDTSGQATITGRTNSTESTFPVTIGPDLTANGQIDAFIARINGAGSALLFAGFIGGSGDDQGRGIALDSTGNAYVVGRTSSNSSTFPSGNSFDLTLGGATDGFIAMVVGDGKFLNYANYIGGGDAEEALAIAVRGIASTVVTGHSKSSDGSFPALIGPSLLHSGGSDSFVMAIDGDRLEADLWPRSGGNRTINLDDWQQVGRFAVGIDSLNNNEFQLADCAPRLTLGDGKIDLLDWIQSGRFAVNADSTQVAGGPSSSSMSLNRIDLNQTPRRLLTRDPVLDPASGVVTVPIDLMALGNENGLTLTVKFDPTVLHYLQAIPGRTEGRRSLINDLHTSTGEVAMGFVLPPGTALSAGTNPIASLQFQVRRPLSTRLVLGDGRVPLLLADPFANPMLIKGTTIILSPPTDLARNRRPTSDSIQQP
jgi:hypothetical protein